MITLYLLFAMLAVIWYDATRYIIPNWLVGSLLAVYPVAVFMSPHAVDWMMALVAMGIVFAIGYGVFMMNWMGGGDIKLIIVCSLWMGWGEALLHFILLFGVLGGGLSVGVWIIRKLCPFMLKAEQMTRLPRILKHGEPVPYGLSIAAAFLAMMWLGKIPVL